MAKNMHERIMPYLKNINKYRCFILPGNFPTNDYEEYLYGPELIIWMHLLLDQFMTGYKYLDLINECESNIKYLVVLSEAHKNEVVKYDIIDSNKIIVINNAIDSLKFNKKKFEKVNTIKIFHASEHYRGTEILLDAASNINLNFELSIFNNFIPNKTYDKRIKFYGRVDKEILYKNIEDSHIHAYPATWFETSCLVQMEAMSAGCLSVLSNVGALPETSAGFSKIVNFEKTYEKNVENFYNMLVSSIEEVMDGKWNPEKQIEYANKYYSWEHALSEWNKIII